jgi:uncharacterized protein (DUF1499 family)
MKYIILSLVTAVAALLLLGCSGKVPQNLGMTDGRFTPCPESHNCVSSQATDAVHNISPIQAHGSPDVVMVDLADSIESIYGGKVVAVEGTYLRAEFTSRVFRFVDDLECFYDEDRGVIEIRSASRLGYSDFNVNRNRVEELRRIFTAKRDG